MAQLFVIAMWVGHPLMAARIAFRIQSVKLRVMFKLRKGLVPIAFAASAFLGMGLAPLTQAHGMRDPLLPGSAVEEPGVVAGTQRDGISLDEAVRMAEAQYHAKVVRTDVQDEDGRKVYVLKLLSEGGRVITVRIDAATGGMR